MLALTLALACSTPVQVRRVPAREVHRSLTANVLSTGRPSATSTQTLHHLDLFERYQREPDAVLHVLRETMLGEPDRLSLLFTLSELEFHRGEQLPRRSARPHFLAAAFYAFRYMVSQQRDGPSIVLDPSWRLAADLYNRGLTAGLATDDGEYVDLRPRTLALPFGQLELDSDAKELNWAGYRMVQFVPVAELEVRGLRNRYRRAGIGAPLAASLEPAELESPPPGFEHISSLVKVPATALVLFGPGSGSISGDAVTGLLRLRTLDDAISTGVGGREVALEYEPTAALAFGLSDARPWEFERRGFLSGDFGQDFDRGVTMLGPYDPKRIPIVFIHGTASSPWRWAEMINHLQSDSRLLADYQFWLFQYNTGNPIPFSAGHLRRDLHDLVAELDPEGDDENLRRMVLVGHSQGGLIAKLCVVDSGDAFWRLVSSAPIDDLDLLPETREVLERSMFFEPLAYVKGIIFLATPHGGSFLAERWFIRFAAGMVAVSRELVDATAELIGVDDDRILLRELNEMPSSVDNMTRDNAFLGLLHDMPIAPGVETHSIIAVSHEDDDPAVAHDGMVTVESQRLEGVDSEVIVRSGHSTQRHPITIGEVARMLRMAVVPPDGAVPPTP